MNPDQQARDLFSQRCKVMLSVRDERTDLLPLDTMRSFCETTDRPMECRIILVGQLKEVYSRGRSLWDFCAEVYQWFQDSFGMHCPEQCDVLQCKATCEWLKSKEQVDQKSQLIKQERMRNVAAGASIERLKLQRAEAEQNVTDASRIVGRAETDLQRALTRKNETSAEVEAERQKVRGRKERIGNLTQKRVALEEDVSSQEATVTGLERKLDFSKLGGDQAGSEVQKLQEKIRDGQASLDELAHREAEANAQLDGLRASSEDLSAEIDDRTERWRTANETVRVLEGKVETAQQSLEEDAGQELEEDAVQKVDLKLAGAAPRRLREPCPRPAGWCESNTTSFIDTQDCDGDGVPDPRCVDADGQEGFFGSASSCASTWPSGKCRESCSRPAGWCEDHGASYVDTQDCDDDGIPDPHCMDAGGRERFIGSARSCEDAWPTSKCQAPRGEAALLGASARLRRSAADPQLEALLNTLRQRLKEALDEAAALEREVVRKQNEIDANAMSAKKAREELARDYRAGNQTEVEMNSLRKELAKAQAGHGEANVSSKELVESIDRAEDKLAATKEELAKVGRTIDFEEGVLREEQAALGKAESAASTARGQLLLAKEAVASAKGGLEKVQAALKMLEEKLADDQTAYALHGDELEKEAEAYRNATGDLLRSTPEIVTQHGLGLLTFASKSLRRGQRS